MFLSAVVLLLQMAIACSGANLTGTGATTTAVHVVNNGFDVQGSQEDGIGDRLTVPIPSSDGSTQLVISSQNLTPSQSKSEEQHEHLKRDRQISCVKTDGLKPIEHDYYLSGPRFPLEYQTMIEEGYSKIFLTFYQLLSNHFQSAEGLLALDMPKLDDHASDNAWIYQNGRAEEARTEIAKLISELRALGYCNDGVTRELSVRAVAEGFAAGIAYSEYGFDGVGYPRRFGSPSLFLSFHDPNDALHHVTVDLQAFLLRTLQASDVWKLFHWKYAAGLRYCDEMFGLSNDQPLSELLDQLLRASSLSSQWSSRAQDIIKSTGYTITEYEEQVVSCVDRFTLNSISLPYEPDELALYLAVVNEQIIRQWLLDNKRMLPTTLVVVE